MLTHLQIVPSAPKRVVILGAHGFVARELIKALQTAQVDVLPVSSRELDLSESSAATALQNLLRVDDTVVMTAAITPDKSRDVHALMKNLRMGEQVALALSAQPCAHFIYISSDAVYDWTHSLVSEATRPSPTDLYSLMHLAREKVLTQAATTARVPFCILRPSAIYGAGDTHNGYGPNRFLRSARAEHKIRLFGQGEETRDHVFIYDVIKIIELTLRHRSTGILNAVSGCSISFGALAGLVQRLGGESVVIESQPRSGPVTHRHFDPTALQRGFPDHRPTGLEIGLNIVWTNPMA